MSLPYAAGRGGERLGLSICVGRLDIIACFSLCTRTRYYEARNGYKPYPNEAPGLFFTQFYSVSRSDVCSYAWLCAHDRENIYSLSCELDGKSLYPLLSSLEAVIMCECQFMEYSARSTYLEMFDLEMFIDFGDIKTPSCSL